MKEAGGVIDRTFAGLDAAVQEFVEETQFNLAELRQKRQRKTYKTTTRSRAIGKGLGEAVSTASGGFLGTLLLPGIGTFIGLLVGGWLGQKAGGVIAPLVWVEEETAEVVVGTNAADIIRQGQQMMRDQAILQVHRDLPSV